MYNEEDYKFSNIILGISTAILFCFITLFIFFFIGLSRVDALVFYTGMDNTQDYTTYGFSGTTRGYIYNCSSSTSCTNLATNSTMANGMIYTTSALTNDTNGFRFDYLVNQPLYKKTLYAITSYYCSETAYTPVSKSWAGVNQGSQMTQNSTYYTLYKGENEISAFIGDQDSGYFVDSCYSVYQVFEPQQSSSYYGLQIATQSGTQSGRYVFLGYNLEVIGATDGLTQGQVQEVVQESANEINNNIDEMTDTIDQGLDNVIENQDKNNQELQDTIDKGLQTCRDSLNLFNNKWTKGQAPSISNGELVSSNNLSMSTDTLYLDNTKSYTLKTDNSTSYTFYVFYYKNNEYLGFKSYNSTATMYIFNSYFPGYTHVILRIDGVQGDYPLFMLNEGNSVLPYEPFGEKVCKSKLDETNEAIKDTNDYLKDDKEPESDISGLGNIEGLLPPGPLDTLLNIPIQFLSSFITGLNESCQPLRFNFFWDMPIEFPCLSTAFYSRINGPLEYAINLIPGVLILIKYFKYLYKKVERATSFNTNADDMWGAI